MNKLKFGFISLCISLMSFGTLGLATVSAASPTADACAGLSQIDASHGCGTGATGVTNIVRVVVNMLSYVIGIVAVIMIIIAGLKYVASSGDSGRITSAKNTLIYALVGLAIAALAQVLVHYVLTQSTKAANNQASISRQLDTA